MTVLDSERELKLEVLAHGIQISDTAKGAWDERYAGPLTLAEYASTSGVALHTEAGVWMNAPFIEQFARDNASVVLDFQNERFVLLWEGQATFVVPTPVPAYHDQKFGDGAQGYPYTRLGVTHTDRCRVSPVQGCAWVCTFCNFPYDFRYAKMRKEELLQVIRVAVHDRLSPARHVLISGGTPKLEDEAWIDEIYLCLAREAGVPVDVMMPARMDLACPARLRAGGVNLLSVNLEIWDERRALRVTPNKARLLGRKHYLDYIEEAVKAFGVGYVQSLMVFGRAIEPIENTLEAVGALAERGCMPVLSAFRPDPITPMGRESPATVEEMRRLYGESLEICMRSGTGAKLGPRCIPCMHNTLTFPDGTDFYVEEGADLTTPPTLHT
jgi:hypothetical protein